MREHPDTVRGLPAPSRLNQGPQTSTGEYLWGLYAYLETDRPYQDAYARAYVVNASDQPGKGDGVRIKIVILARDGRYICIWQPRKHFGPLRLCKIWRKAQPIVYGYFQGNLAKRPALPTTSLEAAGLFLNTLGEGVADRREAG